MRFRAGRCESRQSDRHAIYESAARELERRGLLYGCTCSRNQIAAASSAGPMEEPRYPGTCRDRGVPIGPGVAWRLRLDRAATKRSTTCSAARSARIRPRSAVTWSIRDRKGNWTYQFVASVDDFRQGIDLVVRGRDLLASTGRQIRIARLLGRTAPATFAHHALDHEDADAETEQVRWRDGIRELAQGGDEPARKCSGCYDDVTARSSDFESCGRSRALASNC